MASEETKIKLERLRAIRGAHRGVLTKNLKKVYDILKDEPIEQTSEQLQRLEVTDRLLEAKLKALEEIDQEVLSLCELEEIEHEIEESERIVERVMKCQKEISDATKGSTGTPINAQESQIAGFNQPITGFGYSSPSSSQAKAKLPKLVLPKFRGDVTSWTGFWDSYKSAVHNNSSLSNIDKFNYLKSLLEGAASRAIQGLALSSSNYDSAVEILEERFGRPQQIISAHMDEILKIQPSTSDRPASLRFVYDQLSVHVRGLSSLGVSSTQYGSLLIPIVMSKLPNEIRLEIARKSTADVWKIEELLDTIKKEIEAREASESVNVSEEKRKPNYTQPQRNSRPPHPTSSALFSKQGQWKKTTQIRCVYCNDHHYSASCEKISNPNDRKSVLIEAKRCFKCLSQSHQVRECTSNKACRNCGGNTHHQSICFGPREVQESSKGRSEGSVPVSGGTVTATSTAKTKGSILLQTATTVATNEDKTKSTTVRILFDSGSQRSYITDNLKAKLGLKPTSTETLHLNTFGENAYRKQKCQVVTLPLRTVDNEYVEITALNFPTICSPLPKSVDLQDHPHLQDLELADIAESSNSIDILIGSDYYWDFVTGESIRGESGLIAVKSKFGWVLSGPTNSSTHDTNVVSNLIISGETFSNEAKENDEVVDMLKNFWEIESLGIVDDEPGSQLPMKFKRNEISFNGRHYETGLPWKEDCAPTSNNYGMCESRLRSLYHKLKNEPNLLSEYDKIIQEQCRTGIVEKVSKSNSTTEIGETRLHYSPHHAVVRKDRETTKVRIVYDGSAKSSKEERSMNDCLEIGDNYIPHIFDMLTKFRWNAVGLTADIEKAFLMVGIKEQDRDMLRFLWYDDPFSIKPEIVEFRFNRLVFGLRPSPSILGATIAHHLSLYKQSEPEMAELLENSLYVDDLLTGEDNDAKGLAVYKKSKQIMAEGGFNLRKWNSNSRELLKAIENCEKPRDETKPIEIVTTEDEESYAKSTTTPGNSELKNDTIVKVLGMNWDTVSDEFFFEFTDLYNYGNSLPATKRSVLKLTAKIFDPIGLLTPCTVEMKILFQELCVDKVDWDSNLEGNLLQAWNSQLEELKCINRVRVPRCYFLSSPMKIELHGFCDASNRAYAGVVYMRSLYEDGRVDVRLVASKSRVAPLKKQTIPRLELLGALILARLVNKLDISGKNVPTVCWTDSMTALCWIKNEKTWKQYVQNRVEEIRELTSRDKWRHCPGKSNPADLPSRGVSAKDLSTNTVWWNGPEFLYKPESEWPERQATNSEDELALQEVVKHPVEVTHSLLSSSPDESKNPKIDKIIDIKRFSDLTNLLRVTALVVKFVNKLKNKVRNMTKPEIGREVLNALDLTKAEELWIKTVQASSFVEEIKFLQNHRQSKATPPIYVSQFGLFLDGEVVKCNGRMNNSDLPVSAKNPILLPAKHEFVRLIIKDVHESVKHSGIKDTLTAIRERFWILRGREAVKQMIKKCVICLRIDGTPYKSQPPADLPSERVSEDPPFTHVGLDFAGPLIIANGNSNESESPKVYICLFTCASTRAVHLELCRSLNVQDFLLSFRRFASRRGLPATLISDNARTFKSSSTEVRKITRSNEVWRYLVNQRISWNFIIEKAPWWGGFWERLVQSVKRPLKKVLGRSTLNFEELRTVLVEIESVINARPITYMYDDANSISYPLTPSDLIYGRRVCSTPNSAHHEIISTHQSLTRRSRHHKNLLQQVTKQWRNEYLTSLREQSNVGNKRNVGQEISIGEIVLLKNDSTKRMFWKLARVEELIPGADGRVRAAIVKVGSSDRRPTYLRRVVQHLIPIEVKSNDAVSEVNEITQTDVNQVPDQVVRQNSRPRRTAAVVGEINRRIMNIA